MTVFVTDYNDHIPTLQEENYSGYIMESAPVGSLVMTDHGPLRVLAEDLDSSNNGLIEFLVEGGIGKHLIAVDPVTGKLQYIYEIN